VLYQEKSGNQAPEVIIHKSHIFTVVLLCCAIKLCTGLQSLVSYSNFCFPGRTFHTYVCTRVSFSHQAHKMWTKLSLEYYIRVCVSTSGKHLVFFYRMQPKKWHQIVRGQDTRQNIKSESHFFGLNRKELNVVFFWRLNYPNFHTYLLHYITCSCNMYTNYSINYSLHQNLCHSLSYINEYFNNKYLEQAQ
jgi:hypothetical protein